MPELIRCLLCAVCCALSAARCLLRHKARSALIVLAIAGTAVGGAGEYLDILVVRPAVENARGRVIPRPGVDSEELADRIRAALDDVEVQSPQKAVQEARQVVREERWA